MKDIVTNESFENGSVKISEDVISVISSLAAREVKGVARMSVGITGEITEMLGMKNASRGVSINISEDDLIIDLYIAVEANIKINELGKEVQKNVKETVENMTGLEVLKVNVNVQEVVFKKDEVKKEERN